MKSRSLDEKVWSKVHKTSGCWLWTGSRQEKGYGRIVVEGRSLAAHRVVYELVGHTIPEGKVLDHICRNTSCVNPDHLRAMTNAENVLIGIGPPAINARKTECKRGHGLTPDNVRLRYRSGGRIHRECKQCVLEYNREFRRCLKARRAKR